MRVTEFLQTKVPFLAGIGEEDAYALARSAEQILLAGGQLLLRQGAPLPGLIVVAEGELRARGKRAEASTCLEARLGPGHVFGEACLSAPSQSPAALEAVARTLVFVIPAAACAAVVERDPALRQRAAAAPPAEPVAGAPQAEGLEIRRLVAQGGMGAVYEAFDPLLHRVVAVKVLRPELRLDPKAEALFLDEARIVASLKHPNIVEIYAICKRGDNLYLVFEFVEGGTLARRIQEKGALPLGDCLRILRMTAAAIEFAHGQKVVHRDLKPSNIMLRPDGVAKVMDFGIARRAKDTLSRLSRTEPFGTFAYMAPEQHLGEARRPADIFSLGVTLYQLLTGELPFSGPDFLGQKEGGTFPLPSSRKPGLSTALDAVVARALCPDPARRHSTVRDLMSDFEDAAAASV